jgi:hypothetical protein
MRIPRPTSVRESILEPTFQSRPFAILHTTPTRIVVLVAPCFIFAMQYMVSVCLAGIFGHPAPKLDPLGEFAAHRSHPGFDFYS